MNSKKFKMVACTIIISAFCIIGLSGCDAEDAIFPVPPVKDSGTQNSLPPKLEGTPYVTFDVPEGWTYKDEQPGGMVGAVWETGSSKYNVNTVNLQLSPYHIYRGNEEDAQKIIKNHYDSLCGEKGCETTERQPESSMKEIGLENGITIYADIYVTSRDKHWYSKDKESPYSWGSNLAFSKKGYVFEFIFTDNPDLYQSEFNLITETLKMEERM